MKEQRRESGLRMPRTVRLDGSDERVYPRAARPGEWAVSGAFVFADADLAVIDRKARHAFASGFLGTATFGWSTFVEVAEITAEEHEAVVTALADHFVAEYGAPNRAAALPVARREVEFAASLCEHDLHTMLMVERELGADGIIERFKAVQQQADQSHAKIWTIVEEEDGV